MKKHVNCRKLLHSLWFRILIGIAIPVGAIAGSIYLYIQRSFVPCSFYTLTGLYCPGCGSGRACVDLLHLHIFQAMEHNILFVLLLPFMLYYGIKIYIKYIFQKDVLPFFHFKAKAAAVTIVISLTYWVIRNLPMFPFNWLAP